MLDSWAITTRLHLLGRAIGRMNTPSRIWLVSTTTTTTCGKVGPSMSWPRSQLTAGIGVAALTAALMVTAVSQVSAATVVTLYASPTGSGTACSQASPCSLSGAQSAVRSELAATSGAD